MTGAGRRENVPGTRGTAALVITVLSLTMLMGAMAIEVGYLHYGVFGR
jgi:hypothetical protein